MPVNLREESEKPLYQREQYAKGGLGRLYWDYRDRIVLSCLAAQDKKIVDVGCGEGITLEKVLRLYPDNDVVGIDALRENVDICLRHNLPARQGDVYHLDMADNSVDTVFLVEVIEHLEDSEKAIREIHRVLKVSGKLIVVFPNDRFFKLCRLLTLKFREVVYDPGHVMQWTPKAMRGSLEGNGFSIFFSKRIPFVFWSVSLHGVIGAVKLT